MSVSNAHLMTCVSGKRQEWTHGEWTHGSAPPLLLLGEEDGSRLGCSLQGSRTVFFLFLKFI